jgi:hypothetical protein
VEHVVEQQRLLGEDALEDNIELGVEQVELGAEQIHGNRLSWGDERGWPKEQTVARWIRDAAGDQRRRDVRLGGERVSMIVASR